MNIVHFSFALFIVIFWIDYHDKRNRCHDKQFVKLLCHFKMLKDVCTQGDGSLFIADILWAKGAEGVLQMWTSKQDFLGNYGVPDSIWAWEGGLRQCRHFADKGERVNFCDFFCGC